MSKSGNNKEEKKPALWRLWLSLTVGFLAISLLLLDLRTWVRLDDPADYAAGILELRAGRTEELASALEAVSYQFISNQLLNDTLVSYVSDSELYDISRWNSIFSDHLEGLAGTVPELEDAVFFDTGSPGRIPMTMSDSLTRQVWIPVRNRIAEEAIRADGGPVWGMLQQPDEQSATNREAGSAPLLCARLIKHNRDGMRLGVLVLLIDPDRLARTVSGFSLDEGIAVSRKTDYSLLLDGEGKVLASVDPSFTMKAASEVIPGFNEHLAGRLPSKGPGRYRTSSYWVVYNPVPARAWTLLSILPISARPFPPLIQLLLLALLGFSAWMIRGNLRTARRVPEAGPREFSLPSWWLDLTPKEASVLLFLLTGKGNKEIASMMGLREQTVKNYLHSAYGRIGAQDRVSAIVILRDAGMDLESIRLYARSHADFPVDPRLFA
jgi:DNA-binding CsgD family transcriptional regulator